QKALQIQRAALAPASPSAQDRAVAAGAAAMAAEARMELARQGLESQPAEADAARPDQPADRGTAEAHQGQCPVCGAGHGTSAQNEALAQHFANTITPRQASGKLISTAV
ncbi:MAG: hypothetical protein OEN20_10660, partial [Gammaproteobacteria bacterium]|nr:hypothetical protein [Gammaproteobacteria bacterium]